jgi:isopenicillin-N epimerase
VLEAQERFRTQMEREPVRFFVRELEPMLLDVTSAVARFVGADEEDVALVRNATEAVNGVLRSLQLAPGDEILVTSHGYNAVANCARFVCERSGAKLTVADVPFPVSDEDQIVEAVVGAVSDKTVLAIVDHISSPTGIVFPVERLVAELKQRGIETLVDGAHGPGMLPLDMRALGAAYYTGNFHKWVCAPKGAAFLWARRDRQAGLLPAVISHGFNSRRSRSRYRETFDWTGTGDPTAWLCVPEALAFVDEVLGGWQQVRERNRALLLAGRDLLCEALGCAPSVPDSMLGFLAALPLPDGSDEPPASALYLDALQIELYDKYRVEVPVVPWPAPPKRLIRISAHAYNELSEYEQLADALRAVFASRR